MAVAELLAQKRADAVKIADEAKALRDANPDGFADSTVAAEFMTKIDKLGELKDSIEGLENDLKGRDEFGKISNWLDEPQRSVPFGTDAAAIANGDEAVGRKALVRRGWELKGDPMSGTWHAPTSSGELVPMFEDDLLFGDLRGRYDGTERSDEERKFAEQTRAQFQTIYRPAFMRSLRLAAKYAGEESPWTHALMDLSDDERKALSAGSETGGGALVPVDTQAEMMQRIAARSVMMGLGRVVTTSRDKVKWPRVQANATSGSVYSSGFVGSWAGETPAFTETDPAFGSFEVPIKKARAATKLGEDFVNDAEANVLAWLAANGAENLGLVFDNGFIAGGLGANPVLEPSGILIGGSSTTDISGTTADTVSNTIADVGSAPKILTLVYSLPEQYIANAKWLMRRSTEGNIRKLVDAQGRFMWGAMGLNAPSRDELEGYPIVRSNFLQAEGTNANKIAVFGDFTSYIIALRAQIALRVLNERFADTDQIGVIISGRVGGALSNEDAVRIGIV